MRPVRLLHQTMHEPLSVELQNNAGNGEETRKDVVVLEDAAVAAIVDQLESLPVREICASADDRITDVEKIEYPRSRSPHIAK